MSETYKPSTKGGSTGTGGSSTGLSGNGSGRDASLTQQASDMGRELKDKASEMAGNVTETVKRTAQEQVSQLGDAAKSMAGNATEKLNDTLNEQKSAGAEYVDGIAQAVRQAASGFEDKVPQAAQYIRQTAGQIDNVASALRDRDVRDLVNEVQSFARRQPGLFFGGAVILGFAALRFLKSTAPGGATHGSSGGGSPMRASSDRSYGSSTHGGGSGSQSYGGQSGQTGGSSTGQSYGQSSGSRSSGDNGYVPGRVG